MAHLMTLPCLTKTQSIYMMRVKASILLLMRQKHGICMAVIAKKNQLMGLQNANILRAPGGSFPYNILDIINDVKNVFLVCAV